MLLFVWFLLELTFWLYIRKSWRRLQQRLKPHALPTYEQRWKLYWNCLHTIYAENFEDWIAGWFYISSNPQREHPKFSDIYKENVALFLSWAFWGDDLETVRDNPPFEIELNEMIYQLETKFNMKFPTGYNRHIQCIRPTLDNFEYIHRPFVIYVINFVFTHIFDYIFLELFGKFQRYGVDSKPGVRWGMLFNIFKRGTNYYNSWWLQEKHSLTIDDHDNKYKFGSDNTSNNNDLHRHQHLTYWYRKGPTPPSSTTPIIFIHGIGTGLHLYIDFIRRITFLELPVFCIELPYVSSRLVEHVPTPKQTVIEIQTMLDTHGFEKATIIGHSLGTVVAGWMAKYATERVSELVLIDPVCFLLNYHDTAYNMLHRIPSKFMEYFIHYFAARELHINYYFNRHFHWYLNNFFVHDIVVPALNGSSIPPSTPSSSSFPLITTKASKIHPVSTDKQHIDSKQLLYTNMKVYLSENDVIINSQQIEKYLNKYGINTTVMPKLNHAEYLLRPRWLKHILSDISLTSSDIMTEEKVIDSDDDEAIAFVK